MAEKQIRPCYWKKNDTTNTRRITAVIILLFVLTAASCGCLDFFQKRSEVSVQIEESKSTLNDVVNKMNGLSAYFKSPEDCDPEELQLLLDDIKSDIDSSKDILDGIDRSVLTNYENEKLDEGYFLVGCLSDYFNPFAEYMPTLIRQLKDYNSAAINGNSFRAKISLNNMYSLTESYIADLEALEEKIIIKQQSSDSETLDQSCTQMLDKIRVNRLQGEEFLVECDKALSKL